MELHARQAQSADEETFLREVALTLGTGQTSNTLICPRCNGGQHRDRAFSITRLTGGIAFLCHRASCGFHGRRWFTEGQVIADERQPRKDRRYRGELNLLPDEVSKVLEERYGLFSDYLRQRGVRWAPEVNRVYIPTPYFHKEGGGILRSLSGEQPKVLSAAAPWSSGMGFYPPWSENHPDFLFVVEDALSALCVAKHAFCVSLQGTQLPQTRLLELVEYAGPMPIVLALDKDATSKAIKYVNDYKYLADIQVLALEKDIKDMKGEERRKMLWNYKY